jgi:putative chitobiose transport system substrate-binding protein
MRKFLLLVMVMAGLGAFALAQGQTQITFWSWYLSPKFDNYLKGVISDFEAQHPDIQVKWLDKGDSMVQDFISAINLGTPPDVVNLNAVETTSAAQNGFLTPVTDYTPLSKMLSVYWGNPVNNYTVNGKVYGYPWYGWVNQGVMVYNSDLFQQAGITQLPTTTDELIADSKKIKDATGAYGWEPVLLNSTAPSEADILGLFYQAGLPIVNSSGQAAFNTPAHAAVLQKYVDLFQGGYVPLDALRQDPFQLSIQLYSQGKLATIIGGPQALTRIQDANKSLYAKTKVAPAPLGKAGVETGGGMDLVIPAASKHKQAAATFAAFMTNNTNQVKFTEVTPIVPTTIDAASNSEFKTSSTDPTKIATSMIVTQGRFINLGYTAPANSADVIKHLNDDVEAALLGKMSAQDALNDAVKFWNANLGGKSK